MERATWTVFLCQWTCLILCICGMVCGTGTACTQGCVRGLCLTVPGITGTTQVCECGLFYEGFKCESVDLDKPVKEIGSNFISFTWTRESFAGNVPNLGDFVFFVYFLNSHNIRSNYFLRDPTGDVINAAGVKLSGLTAGGYKYVTCLIHNSTSFDNLTDTEFSYLVHENRKSCLSFRTGYDTSDPYTLAALWVAGCMSVAMVLVFFAGIVKYCSRNDTAGGKLRRSLRTSLKEVFLNQYGESKARVLEREEGQGQGSHFDVSNSGFILKRPGQFDGHC